jgi:hypothetical protein
MLLDGLELCRSTADTTDIANSKIMRGKERSMLLCGREWPREGESAVHVQGHG